MEFYPGNSYGMISETMGNTPMLFVDSFNPDMQGQGQAPQYNMMVPPQMGSGANMGYPPNMSPQALYEAAAAAAMYGDPQQQQYTMDSMMVQPGIMGHQMQMHSIDPRMHGGHHHGRHHEHHGHHVHTHTSRFTHLSASISL